MNLKAISDWLQFDLSLSWALVARVWQAVSGPITLWLLLRSLTVPEQGLYYALQHVIGVQPLFELGLASVLISQAGSAYARLCITNKPPEPNVECSNSKKSSHELMWLARASLKWFTLVAGLYLVGGLLLGWQVLHGSSLLIFDWRLLLLMSVGLSAISLAVSPRIYILEGAGEREFVYRMRLLQALAGTLVMWISLVGGLKLWAIVAVFAVNTAFSIWIAFGPRAHRRLSRNDEFESRAEPEKMSWLSRLGPLQWRMAILSAAHYFATQTLLLFVVKYHGETASAPLGATLTIAVAIQALALAWAQTKFPLISAKQAAGLREESGTLWRQTTIVSASLLVLAILALAALAGLLPFIKPAWTPRFLSPWLILVLGIGFLANHFFALQSFYVLSRGARPLFVPSLTGLLCTAVAVWLGGWAGGVAGVLWAYSLSMMCVTLPLHTWAYLKFRSR